jgi:hypothetical protein
MFARGVAAVGAAIFCTPLLVTGASADTTHSKGSKKDNPAAMCTGGAIYGTFDNQPESISPVRLKLTNGTGTINNCVSNPDLGLKSATLTINTSGSGDCLHGWRFAGNVTVTWNTGEQMRLALTNARVGSGVGTYYLRVLDGRFKGRRLYMQTEEDLVGFPTVAYCMSGEVTKVLSKIPLAGNLAAKAINGVMDWVTQQDPKVFAKRIDFIKVEGDESLVP